MTDKEIIKALECLFGYVDCRECPYSPRYQFPLCQRQVAKDTLDLITRQQAEIERLKPFEDKIAKFKSHIRVEDMLVFASSLEEWLEFCDNLKAEVYKECIAKVKNYIKTHCNPYGKPDFDYDTSIKILNFIDKLSKEMVGDDNA